MRTPHEGGGTRGTQSRENQPGFRGLHRKTLELGAAGGLAFWVTNFATSLLPIAAQYRAELSISYALMVVVESLLGGLIIGCAVSYALLRLFPRIPSERPILKSVTLSLGALVIIQAFATVLDLGYPPFYIFLGAALNLPRFLALGMVIGLLYDGPSDRILRQSRVRGRPSGS
jgi:hypothetical protein